MSNIKNIQNYKEYINNNWNKEHLNDDDFEKCDDVIKS